MVYNVFFFFFFTWLDSPQKSIIDILMTGSILTIVWQQHTLFFEEKFNLCSIAVDMFCEFLRSEKDF